MIDNIFNFARDWFEKNPIDWAKIFMPIVVVALAILFYSLIKRFTKNIFKRSKNRFSEARRQRVDTIRVLVVNIEKYITILIVITIIMSIYGIDMTSVIAGLGIVTAIVGLAFQDLAKDIIAGVSIITENQFDVGDSIEVDGFRGNVVALGLKTTKIQNYRGQIKCVANHNITQVTNYSDKNSIAEVKVGVSYKHKSEEVEAAFQKVAKNLEGKLEEVVGEMKINGISDFSDSGVVWCVSVECKPSKNIPIERAIRREIKSVFDKEGIEIPYPQVVVNQAKR